MFVYLSSSCVCLHVVSSFTKIVVVATSNFQIKLVPQRLRCVCLNIVSKTTSTSLAAKSNVTGIQFSTVPVLSNVCLFELYLCPQIVHFPQNSVSQRLACILVLILADVCALPLYLTDICSIELKLCPQIVKKLTKMALHSYQHVFQNRLISG